MKRLISAFTAICAVLTVSGCNTQTDEVATTTEAAATTETTTTTAEVTTTSAETTTTASETAAEEEKVVFNSFPDGTVLYESDNISENGFKAEFKMAFVTPSGGIYHDSIDDSGLFDDENYDYKGETAAIDNITAVRAGDKFGGYEIAEASLQYERGDEYCCLFSNTVILKDEITLSGVLYYYCDDEYGISMGDINFIPDSSYKGLPLPQLTEEYGGDSTVRGTTVFEQSKGGISVYSEAPLFRCGNLYRNYADNNELDKLLDGGNAYKCVKATVTLKDVRVSWSANWGLRAEGAITNVSEIK